MVAALERYADVLDLDAIRTALAERHLRHFVRQAWHTVEPATEYQHNWHIDALCDHLEAALDGRIRNLLITIPPRTMKTLIVSVFFPAWAWIHKPELRFLYASYAQRVSEEHSVSCRTVIASPWYQERWGHIVQLKDDDNGKQRFGNTQRGYRLATSVGGAVTAYGADILVADDPHNVQQAESAAVREAAVRWWNQSMATRLNNPKTGVRIVVMQRVHEDDVAGSVLARGTYTHLNIPMEYEGDSAPTPIGWKDPRTEPGELLWPERFNEQKIAEFKLDLGSYAYAAQFQQRPAPAEGGIIKRHWFGYYEARHPSATQVVQSWDTAFKTGADHDYSVCTTWAYGPTGVYLMDVYRERLEFPDLVRAVTSQYLRHRPAAVLIEDKASGQSLIQQVRRKTSVPTIGVPVVRDKVQRVNEVAPRIESGRVLLPVAATWLDETLHELTAFPMAAHDDIVDSVSQALTWIFAREESGEYSGTWLPDDQDDDEEWLT